MITNKVKDYHVKRLSTFNLDASHYDPTAVALRDDGELFILDKITQMKGDPSGPKGKLFFLVHWLGFQDPTWEPWCRVRTTAKLLEFLTLKATTNKKFKKLIPKTIIHPNDPILSDSEAEEQDIFSDQDEI